MENGTPLCECGCGQHVGLWTSNRANRGQVKGQPKRFVAGHSSRAWRNDSKSIWKRVEVKGPDECWEFTGKRHPDGYAVININRVSMLAHRVAWWDTYGEIPSLFVCHKCDNRACCNPNHLFLGTPDDNSKDMVRKGRSNPLRGEHKPTSKLKASDIPVIRALYASGALQKDIALLFKVHQTAISQVIRGTTWSHL